VRVLGPVLDRYLADPTKDAELRSAAGIPADAYYTVSVFPVSGEVTVDLKRKRSTQPPKISKST
jgi:hypothetical protein